MRLVVLESPYSLEGKIERNVHYAKLCVLDCLKRGEAPIASHLLYAHPEVLDDTKPLERALGMIAGRAWYRVCDAVVLYTDLGTSNGMQIALDLLRKMQPHTPFELRTLPPEVLKWFRSIYRD